MTETGQYTIRRLRRRERILAAVLAILGGLSAISLAVAMLDPDGFFGFAYAVPGRFLFAMMHVAAWWVPLYLWILAVFAGRPAPLTWPSVVLVNLVHIPVLTIAAILRLLTLQGEANAPFLQFLTGSFTHRGALLVLSLVLALESVGLLQVWRMFEFRARKKEEEPDLLRLPAPLKTTVKTDTVAEPAEEPTGEPTGEPTDNSEAELPDVIHGSDEIQNTLAALRRRMEEGLEEPVASDIRAEPEAPLPLYFRRDPPILDIESDEIEDEEDEVIGRWDDPDDLFEDEPEPAVTAPVQRPVQAGRRYVLPIDGILRQYSDGRYWEIDDGTRDAGEVLRVTLEEFGIKAEVTGIRKGPVITMFEILPAPGVKLAKITNLADNIALRLAASSVRIVAPIPGKHAVGIEIPNKERNIVSFGELLRDDEFFGDRFDIPIALGKDIAGEAQIVDLARTPHLLIAGATGSGKSVCVNSIICSVLYRQTPAQVKLILIDPKIVELKFYNDIPHLLTPVITDPKRAFQALQYLIYEMERRYSLLDSLGARDISGYNAKIKRKNLATEPLPYIVVIIDEFADLMATSGKELESTVARLAAMSRAVGIHIVLATQRPSTDVITGLIKANIPSRIAFMVASKVDSRIIIDTQGAEKLLGRGDMLFTSSSDPFPVRIQGAFLSEDEVERVVEEVKTFGEPDYIDDEIFIEEDDDDIDSSVLEDPLMEKAIEVVTTSRKASASYLQRRLKVGYNRAARMVEEMERIGIVGPQNGSKPRDVIGSA